MTAHEGNEQQGSSDIYLGPKIIGSMATMLTVGNGIAELATDFAADTSASMTTAYCAYFGAALGAAAAFCARRSGK